MRIGKSDVFLGMLLIALYSGLGGWFFMLAVGVVHHQWIKECPTIGFWWAVLLASLIRGALYTYDSKE
jgi:hypothetical protein